MAQAVPKKSLSARGVLGALIALALIVGGYFGWRGLQSRDDRARAALSQQTPQAVPVQAAPVKMSDVPIYLTGLGSVQAFNTVTIRSRVDGEIQHIAFTEGQTVNEGDLLVQIDPRPYQAALDQAVAKKAQDEATLVSANADLERTRQLSERSFASKQQFDQQQATVNALMAQIKADQAAIDNAQTQLSYTTIRSPVAGLTGFRLVDQGNIVHAADTSGIVQITQIEPISVVFTVPEDQLPSVNRAQKEAPLKVTALSSDGKQVLGEGEVRLLNNQVDTATGTIRMKAAFDNHNHALWPGLSVSTRLLVQTLKGVATVPGTAVQRGPNGLYVYVVKPDNTVEMRQVQVGPITENSAVIEEGLKPGELVVTAGHSRLRPGAKVEVADGGARQMATQER
ncbi:efflux RND transporter periplasmic adaptor subunit [Microvirga flavescens]|uniref:efflux RND transporter periplasmic adaptor subunit n=1 Tax=Microvirga flavescens TaxID=2249811 RepID=UPI000DDA377D|nr:efflux RND transporter periplasmic adaptor subunit [Microvirga flavescens]